MREPLTEAQIEAFEAKHGVRLPEAYRRFLRERGNGGQVADHVIFGLGETEAEHEAMDARVLDALAEPFDPDAAESFETGDEWLDALRGALPIASGPSHESYWLVITGDERGQVWMECVHDGEAAEAVTGDDGELDFAQWVQSLTEPARAAPPPAAAPSELEVVFDERARPIRVDDALRAVIAEIVERIDAGDAPADYDEVAFIRDAQRYAYYVDGEDVHVLVHLERNDRRWFELELESLRMIASGDIRGFDTYSLWARPGSSSR